MTRIQRIQAREVLDSRGYPTVEAEVHCEDGAWGQAIAPAGASTGSAEAKELRDGDPLRFGGRGVRRAVANVREIIAPAIQGMDPENQSAIDDALVKLDGTVQKSRLGANAILAVSLATAHAAAASRKVPLYVHLHSLWQESCGAKDAAQPRLPLPMVNMISGGLHAGGNLDFQDFLTIPAGATTYSDALVWTERIYRQLGRLLLDQGYNGRLVGDEGGYGPRLESNRQAATFLVSAVEKAGLRAGTDVLLAIDVAATHFYQEGAYVLEGAGDSLSSEKMILYIDRLTREFPVVSVEDALAEDDWENWTILTGRLGKRVQLVGDDLFATNVSRLQRGIKLGAANSVLIKLNQAGTLSETFAACRVARNAGYRLIVSARSGETEDTTIADLAVAVAADQIKIGSIVRSERLAKYNRLLRIEEALGQAAWSKWQDL
jgi:enolase